MPCWQSGWRELQSPGVPWLPDGRGNNLQSFHSPGCVKTSSNPVPTGNGLYCTSAFFASAKTLASILRSCLWSLFQKGEGEKKEDADLGHRGYEGLLRTRWQDSEIWCPYLNCCQVAILICDRLLWNESCCFFMVTLSTVHCHCPSFSHHFWVSSEILLSFWKVFIIVMLFRKGFFL